MDLLKLAQRMCKLEISKSGADTKKLIVEPLVSGQYTWIHRDRIFDFVPKVVSNCGPFENGVVFSTPKLGASFGSWSRSEKTSKSNILSR